jgi:peptide/nickel transport system ATP-binding protein
MLVVEDLHVGFELPDGTELQAVRGVSFELSPGERFALVGESGCGKSTTLMALMGLLPSNAWVSGSVRMAGDEVLSDERRMRALRWRELALVPQGAMNALNPVRTVGRQIVEPMLLHGTAPSRRAATARARDLFGLVGLPTDRLERYPHELSGGMRQRAMIAMALACEPKILLADEPTTALDVMVQAQILALVRRLCDELGLALVLVTHDLGAVAQLCDRAAVMYAGRLVEVGPVEALFHDPRHPYTRRLFEATPRLGGEGRATSIPGAPPALDQPLPGCPFLPRCDRSFDRCPVDDPALIEVAPGRRAACHLNDPAHSRTGAAA